MTTSARRKRHRTLAWIAALAVAGVVLLVTVAVVMLLRSPESPPSAVPPGVLPPPSTSTHPHKPRPASQDASCPDVQVIDVPGTWESSPQDDPLNPLQFPNALLHKAATEISHSLTPPKTGPRCSLTCAIQRTPLASASIPRASSSLATAWAASWPHTLPRTTRNSPAS